MRAGGVVRFAVVDDASRPLSSIWRVWLHGDDIYAAVRSLAGEFKTSLHVSGRSRHAFATDEAAQRFLQPGRDRATSRWHRPDPQVPGGTLLLQIIFPEPALGASLSRYELPSGLVRLQPPPKNHVIYVSIVATAAGVKTEGPRFADRPTHTLASWRTPSDTTVWVVAHDALLTEDNLTALDNARRLATAVVDQAILPPRSDEQPSELRGFFILKTSDGVGRIIDHSMEFVRWSGASPAQDIG